MSNLQPLRNSLPRKGRHWSQNVHECVLLRGSTGNFNLHIVGGAENGEFICIGEVRQDRLRYKRGKIYQGDIVLEINGKPVAGYTQFDVLPLIKSSNEAVTLHTVKQGDQITRDLQHYLSTKFDKTSVDSDLQQTIRENLYNRTIPCTTRSPRNGEIPGVDYVFLSLEEFIKLERSGNLLESGIYEGNHYGTPKPPREPLPADNMIYVPGKSEAMSNGRRSRSEDNLGPLPPNWEIAFTEDNVKYFIDHSTGTTQWVDPRLAQIKKATVDECDDDELPYGWERVEDPKYGTYYIDHVNRKTQFENPVQARRRQSHSSNMSYSTAPPPHEGPPSFQSAAALAKAQEAEAQSRWPEVEFSQPTPPAYTDDSSNHHPRTYPYSIEGKQLQGEVITTELHKGSRGFGFTIVGGDQVGELLQIKSIVPDGAAAKDGVLRMGDALTRVNGMSVLSRSHQDVVSMFQAMPSGESVELEVVRGYPLPFDPDDPNVETIGSYTVVHGPSPGSESPLPRSSEENSPVFPTYPPPHGQGMNKWSIPQEPPESPFAPAAHTTSAFPRTSTTNTLPRSSPELLTVPVVKGPMGFGFTIADSPYGQKVKQILDAPRCQGLQEGDILVEINGRMIRSCTHNEAVNILKECPKGQEAFIRVQRGGIPTPLRNSPAFGRREQEPEPIVSRAARPKSTPVMSSNHVGYRRQVEHGSTGNLATTGESTRNQETGYENRKLGHPTLDKSSEALFNSYPSLKKAVANAARRSMENLNIPEEEPPPASPDAMNFTVHLQRSEMGFGFRIIGGQEEGTQVAIGTIVRGGPADLNGDLRRGDEIHYVDGMNVIGSTHRRVISLMGNAALAGEVTLGIHRNPARTERLSSSGMMRRSRSASSELSEATLGGIKAREGSKSMGNLNQYGRRPYPEQEETSSMRSFHSTPGDNLTAGGKSSQRNRSVSESDASAEPQGHTYYRDITLEKEDNESFGFVILSSVQKTGPTIGRIIQGSPADRCRQLHVGDRLVAVNNVSIDGIHHSDIVDTIKQSGRTVTLRIAQQRPLETTETKKLSRMSVPDIARASNSYESETDGRRDADQWNRDRTHSEQVLPDRARDESRFQSYPRTLNHNSDIPKRNHTYERDTNTRRDTDQWNRDNSYSEQVLPDRTRVESRFQSFPRTQNHNSQLPPKVPPRVAPKPSRERVLMARKENSVNDVRSDIRRRSNPEIPSRPPPSSQNYSGGMRDERDSRFQTMEVELGRDHQGYGFSIRGGRELNLPIFVLRMAEGGAAERDGRLRVGDEILEINGRSTENIPHADAIALIKSGGNRVRLLIHRSDKPLYHDGIPNGGQNITKGGSLPRATWKNPSYNAMYQ